jgi:putative oxidoreductase
MLDFLGGFAAWGPTLIRLGAGFTLVVHGYPKLLGPQPGPKGFAGYLKGVGVPSPMLMAYVVAITEIVGGGCLLIGFFTRLAALVVAIEFLVIILKIKWSKGFLLSEGGWEWDWALLAMMLSLLLTGPGRLALDHRIHTGL